MDGVMQRVCLLAGVFLVTLTIGCSCNELDGLAPAFGTRHFFDEEGKYAARGDHTRVPSLEYEIAEANGERLPRWREFLRVGPWLYMYDTGKSKARLSYKIGTYTECCVAGPCPQYHEFRDGSFEAWWPNQELMARGTFEIVMVPIRTNCGGDKIKRGVIGNDAEFWDSEGRPSGPEVLVTAGIDLENL